MHIVYCLRSRQNPDRYYTGHTTNLDVRLDMHNRGKIFHTAKWLPWELVVAVCFPTESKAVAFERYLKSGSGRAFAKRHF